MKKSIALMFAAGTLFLGGCCTAPHHAKWEYKQSATQVSDATLNQWADEGWSVVCVGTDSNGGHFYILKRPKK
jgi:hypothetical protein